MRIVWNPEMVEFLRKNYKETTDKEIAVRLGVPVHSVTSKRRQLGLAKGRLKRPKIEEVVHQDRETGQIGNLKGSMFNLACQLYIHQKYLFLFRFGPLPTYLRRIGTDVRQTVAYACGDQESFEAISSLFPRSKPLWPEEAGDWRLRVEGKNARRSRPRKRPGASTQRNINRILKREEEYRELTRGFYLEPDFVVFTSKELHIYEFKFSRQVRLTEKQREFVRFLKERHANGKRPSKVAHMYRILSLDDLESDNTRRREKGLARVRNIKARFFVLRPAHDFLDCVTIESREMG